MLHSGVTAVRSMKLEAVDYLKKPCA